MTRIIFSALAAFLFVCICIDCGTGKGNSPDANYPDGGIPDGGQSTPNLIFSTYLGGVKLCDSCDGGSPHTFAQNAASDSQGNTYITGATEVSDLPFPITNSWQNQPAAGSSLSAFVAKYSPAGNLLWGT